MLLHINNHQLLSICNKYILPNYIRWFATYCNFCVQIFYISWICEGNWWHGWKRNRILLQYSFWTLPLYRSLRCRQIQRNHFSTTLKPHCRCNVLSFSLLSPGLIALSTEILVDPIYLLFWEEVWQMTSRLHTTEDFSA